MPGINLTGSKPPREAPNPGKRPPPTQPPSAKKTPKAAPKIPFPKIGRGKK